MGEGPLTREPEALGETPPALLSAAKMPIAGEMMH